MPWRNHGHASPPKQQITIEFVPKPELDRAEQEIDRLRRRNRTLEEENDRLRKDLEELTSTGKSLMPEGLEKEVQPQDLADLIAFIRADVVPAQRKSFEGNKPELVTPLGGSKTASHGRSAPGTPAHPPG